MPPDIGTIFRRCGTRFLSKSRHLTSPEQLRALEDLGRCRTPAMGGHRYRCRNCGHELTAWLSCRNRHCPQCGRRDLEDWLEKQRQLTLPADCFHLVFTLPWSLRGYCQRRPKEMYAVLFQTAVNSLKKLAADPKYVGGRLAIMAVLHTWTRTLDYHPHLHVMVPAAAINSQGTALLLHRDFLVPVRALSEIFRASFMKMARRIFPDVSFPENLWHQKWNVYCRRDRLGTPDRVVNYLGRYLFRVAITNSRIVAFEDDRVTFYTRGGATETLSGVEFVRRFLRHVLPRGFHKIRRYDLFHPANTDELRSLRAQLVLSQQQCHGDTVDAEDGKENSHGQREGEVVCPVCHHQQMLIIEIVKPEILMPP